MYSLFLKSILPFCILFSSFCMSPLFLLYSFSQFAYGHKEEKRKPKGKFYMVHSPMAYLVSPHASIKLNERGHVGKNDSHCGSKSKKLKHLGKLRV